MTTAFTWDVARGIPVVLDDGTARYVHGPAGLLSQHSAQGARYYLADGLGSTLKTVDAGGNVVNSYTYDVYGKLTGQSGGQANEFQFAGEQTDGTGLQYLRNRYYDPATGRFISRDPLSGLPGWANNPFGYAEGNPLKFVDPLGLDPVWSDELNAWYDPGTGTIWDPTLGWIDPTTGVPYGGGGDTGSGAPAGGEDSPGGTGSTPGSGTIPLSFPTESGQGTPPPGQTPTGPATGGTSVPAVPLPAPTGTPGPGSGLSLIDILSSPPVLLAIDILGLFTPYHDSFPGFEPEDIQHLIDDYNGVGNGPCAGCGAGGGGGGSW